MGGGGSGRELHMLCPEGEAVVGCQMKTGGCCNSTHKHVSV